MELEVELTSLTQNRDPFLNDDIYGTLKSFKAIQFGSFPTAESFAETR